MQLNFDSIKPIYIQVAETIEEDIITGKLKEGEPAYSQLTLSRELNINPATAAKGINVLVQKGILEKQRGLSMIVSAGAKERLLFEKRENNFMHLAKSLVCEANMLDITEDQVIESIKKIYSELKRGNSNDENLYKS